MTFGESHKERYGECSKADAFEILDHFYKEGGNFVDTANAYRDGESEIWLGEWMSSRNVRDEIVLATKYTSGWQHHKDDVLQSNYIGTGSKSMRLSLESSLQRLQTTYIDIFYVHWWDDTTTIPELMHSLNDLVVSGKVIYLGISDTPAWVVSMANEYARHHGLRPFVVYQGMWNAGMRDFERDILPMCMQQGMAICAYGVLGAGRFQTEAGFEQREKGHDGRKFVKVSEHDKLVSKVLEGIARDKGVELLHVALAYVQQKAPYVFPLVGQRKISHLAGSIAGLSVTLTTAEIEKIESSYLFDHGFPHTFLSGSLFENTTESRQIRGPQDVWLTRAQTTTKYDWVQAPEALRPQGSNK